MIPRIRLWELIETEQCAAKSWGCIGEDSRGDGGSPAPLHDSASRGAWVRGAPLLRNGMGGGGMG